MIGIYKITNKLNGKVYIGKSIDIETRWKQHIYNPQNSAIHLAICKYGKDNFNFEIIEQIPIEQLDSREKYWINYYNSISNGYNCTYGGEGVLKYNYNEIIELWEKGYSYKNIKDIINCSDSVIRKALRYNNINESQVKTRSNGVKSKSIVAIDIFSGKELKIFDSINSACLFLNKNLLCLGELYNALKNSRKHQAYGYYWEYLLDNNIPKKDLTDEEFLSYQILKPKRILKSHISSKRCDREELKNLIRNIPFTHIGKKFGVSDNTIRKWCDYYNLPHRVTDIKKYTNEEWSKI